MKPRTTIVGLLLAVLWTIGVMLSAQAPLVTPPPALDASSKTKIETVQRAAQLANAACVALDAMWLYNDVRQMVMTDVEGKYPGYTVNWQTATLIAKSK